MENNHTDVGQFQEAPRRRVEARPAEKPKFLERLSITEWIVQTLDEMKRRVGWFKENPEVTQVRQMTREYPALREEMETQLTKVERKADEALREATEELQTMIEPPTPIEVIQPERFVTPVSVDFMDKEAWQNFKYSLINDFEQSFGQAAPAEGDFEVALSAPLSTTTLGQAKERGQQPVRVRSESVGGVRVDAIMSPPDSKKISEFRIYDLSGYYKTIPGDEDPVEMLIDRSRANQITFQNWIKAEERARETKRILLGDQSQPSATSQYEFPLTLDHLVQKHRAILGSPKEYAQWGERMFKTTEMKGGKGPEVGPLTTPTRAEPAVSFGETAADWVGTEPEMRPPASETVKSETWFHEQGTGIESVPPTPVMVEEFEEEEYEDVSGEIPDLVRQLRGVHGTLEDARLAANRAREILATAGSEKMIDVTRPMLQKLDNLKTNSYINEKVYQRALATLINADNFNDREQAVANLQADLPLPMMHQPGKMRRPIEEFPKEPKETEKRKTA